MLETPGFGVVFEKSLGGVVTVLSLHQRINNGKNCVLSIVSMTLLVATLHLQRTSISVVGTASVRTCNEAC